MSALAAVIDRSRRDKEDWCYTDLEKLLKVEKISATASDVTKRRSLPCLIEDSSEHQRIVFRNGEWDKAQSQLGDLPASVLTSNATDGYQIKLAGQSCLVTAPIELVFLSEGVAETSIKLQIDVGANTSVSLIEHHQSIGLEAKTHIVEMDIRLGKQAKLAHEKIAHDLRATAHVARTNVSVDEGAFYRNFCLVKNTRLMRHEIDVMLNGELAQCLLSGALLLQGREHADVVTRVHHMVPHGISCQLYKVVVKDSARGVFQGRIKVAEGAQKTDGKQLCRALLLSDQAEMDAKPELEIYADDVSCSHGCAISDLDADAMFYLRSRGLNEHQARSLLMHAFVDEAIDSIQAQDTQAYVRQLAKGWMNE